jgi:hypothetical protein
VRRAAPAACAAVLACLVLAPRARAASAALEDAVLDLDGDQFLVDEPVWLCADPAGPAAPELPGFLPHGYELRGTDAVGRRVRARCAGEPAPHGAATPAALARPTPRSGEFGLTFNFHDPTGREPLLGFATGIPAGAWEVHRAGGTDSARVVARFRVIEPLGSERFVRDGLARAARLSRGGGDAAGAEQAARLYDAILRRYPRTAYLSVVYAGLWRVRAHTRFGDDPDRWLEEIFARFHEGCFGTAALDAWVRDMGEERARKTVARLVGLYPDTPLSRAAQRYLR